VPRPSALSRGAARTSGLQPGGSGGRRGARACGARYVCGGAARAGRARADERGHCRRRRHTGQLGAVRPPSLALKPHGSAGRGDARQHSVPFLKWRPRPLPRSLGAWGVDVRKCSPQFGAASCLLASYSATQLASCSGGAQRTSAFRAVYLPELAATRVVAAEHLLRVCGPLRLTPARMRAGLRPAGAASGRASRARRPRWARRWRARARCSTWALWRRCWPPPCPAAPALPGASAGIWSQRGAGALHTAACLLVFTFNLM
jgi:hypothetical protein